MVERLLLAGVVICIALLGVVDYFTGRELNFFVFYFIPVSIGAYYRGLLPSVAVSILCAATWAIADHRSAHEYSSHVAAVWNTMIRLTAFVCIGAAVARIKVLLDQQRTTTRQLQTTLAELKVLQGLLSICAHCKKIREADGSWQQLEWYITQHSEAQFTHGICPACRRRLLEEAGLAAAPPTAIPSAPAPPSAP